MEGLGRFSMLSMRLSLLLCMPYLDAAGTPGWSSGPDFYTTQALRDFVRSQVRFKGYYVHLSNPTSVSMNINKLMITQFAA